jgi:hypothetical protein
MDSLDNFRERLEALERRTRTSDRRARWWCAFACGVLMLSVLSLAVPSGTAPNQSLEQRVTNLESTLAAVTFDAATHVLTITGANLRIVNGLGGTDTSNGLGNLIVGYNELRSSGTNTRTGSHNIVVGRAHNFSGWGGVVVGVQNEISGAFASVSGGQSNTASEEGASVSGGVGNTASGPFASVSGGFNNTASGANSSVSGGGGNLPGEGNTASGNNSSVSGGAGNTASGLNSVVSGGGSNIASGNGSVVSGGEFNEASGGPPPSAGDLSRPRASQIRTSISPQTENDRDMIGRRGHQADRLPQPRMSVDVRRPREPATCVRGHRRGPSTPQRIPRCSSRVVASPGAVRLGGSRHGRARLGEGSAARPGHNEGLRGNSEPFVLELPIACY